MKLAGWGKYPVIDARLHAPRSEEALRKLVQSQASVIARGNGRAYGDAAINADATLSTKHLNKMIRFDDRTGQLEAEAGVIPPNSSALAARLQPTCMARTTTRMAASAPALTGSM